MPLFFQMPKNFLTMQLWRLFSLTILFSSLLFYIRIFIAAILEGQGRGNYLEKHFVPHNLIVKEFISLPSVFTKAQFALFCLFCLPLEELKMHVDHLRLTAERRKEGARKAATTRKTKAASTRKKKKSNTAGSEQLSEYLNFLQC